MKRNMFIALLYATMACCARSGQSSVSLNAKSRTTSGTNKAVKGIVIEVGEAGLTDEERKVLRKEQAILEEIIELYAKKALDRPKDIGVCVREMFAMYPSGECRDRFTHYTPQKDAETKEEDLSGEFGGVGIELTIRDTAIVVVAPLSGTPAERAGLKPGDVIIKVDDKEVTKLAPAVQAIRGKIGTKVKLTVVRENVPEPIEFILTREKIVAVSVESRVLSKEHGIGLVKINQFQENTTTDFIKALDNLRKKKVERVVIDLRNNPGGFLYTAESMLDLFIKPGDTMVTIRTRDKTEEVAADATLDLSKQSFRTMKVVVLINGGSASASEIFAGTMKDWGYQIVGEKSFGKGVGQNIFTLSDGSLLTLTTFEFLVGNNKVAIRDKGVTPTVEVKQPDEPRVPGEKKKPDPKRPDLQLDKAIELLKAM